MTTGAARRFLLAFAICAFFCAGCSSRPPAPVLQPLKETKQKVPVILIPGTTGVQLRDVESGNVVWGDARSLFLPRDGGRSLALPVVPDFEERPRLEAFAPILELKLPGLPDREIYGPLLRMMEQNGYRPGRLSSPRPTDTFFFFVYDWRRSTEQAAGELARRLEALRVARGDERLRVDLICQSGAAMIGRYYLKYGGGSLDQAESGEARPSDAVEVRKLILVGTANAGSLRTLRLLDRGRRYASPFGRRFRPETLFTLPALYDGLPTYRDDLLFDERGNVLRVDLFDARNWQRYGWSVFGRESRQRIARLDPEKGLGDEQHRLLFLERNLARARRLHRLLASDVPVFDSTRYYSLQNHHRETPLRAMLVSTDRGWRTFYPDDREVRKHPERLELALAPGDGHATVESQNRLSPQESAALDDGTTIIDGGHFEMILAPEAQRRLLEILLEEVPDAARPTARHAVGRSAIP